MNWWKKVVCVSYTHLGVEEENCFTLNYDKYNWEDHPDHFILQDADRPIDFGEGKKNIYALSLIHILHHQ